MRNCIEPVAASGSKLKVPYGWFAAGAGFRRALAILSDGAFRLFAYVSMQADRGTGRYEVTQGELAHALGKSRRIIGVYINELRDKEICSISAGKNQHARNTLEILDDYWPYARPAIPDPHDEDAAYVAEIRDRFLATGCTRGNFSAGDVKTARALKQRGVSLELVHEALLLGACRKYDSWLNGGLSEPIASLRYIEPLVSQIQDQPLPPRYRHYLQSKLEQLERMWREAQTTERSPAAAKPGNDG